MLPGPSPNAATLTYRMPFGNVQSMHVRIVFHSHDCITSDYHPAQPPSLHPARPPPHPLHRVRVTKGRARPRQSVSRLCRRHSATQRDPSSAEAAADESDSHPEVPSYRPSTRLHRYFLVMPPKTFVFASIPAARAQPSSDVEYPSERRSPRWSDPGSLQTLFLYVQSSGLLPGVFPCLLHPGTLLPEDP